MQADYIGWNKTEEEIGQKALKKAYEREINDLIQTVRESAIQIVRLDDLWQLNDFLSAKRHHLDGKYNYSDSMLLFILAQLIQEGWLYLDDLEGLSQNKLTKISALTRM